MYERFRYSKNILLDNNDNSSEAIVYWQIYRMRTKLSIKKIYTRSINTDTKVGDAALIIIEFSQILILVNFNNAHTQNNQKS